MKRYSLAPALAPLALICAIAAGCDFAARTGVLRDDMLVLTQAQKAIADTKINHGDMTIRASADRADTTYEPGQPIVLSVSTSKDAHVAILRVLANGDTTLVFPNKAHPKADIAANEVLTVPGPGDGITIAADKPQVVLFEFIASTAADSWLFKRAPDKDSDFADLGVTTKLIATDVVASLKVGKGAAETAATYVTVRVR
jgi:uncharacterized protein DUF4384